MCDEPKVDVKKELRTLGYILLGVVLIIFVGATFFFGGQIVSVGEQVRTENDPATRRIVQKILDLDTGHLCYILLNDGTVFMENTCGPRVKILEPERE